MEEILRLELKPQAAMRPAYNLTEASSPLAGTGNEVHTDLAKRISLNQ